MRPDRLMPTRPQTALSGFSLVELMITLVLLSIVVAVIATVLIGSERSKADTEGRLQAQQNGRNISDVLAADIRTAGYQVDTDASPEQPPFAYVDSLEIIINSNQNRDTTAANLNVNPLMDSTYTWSPQAIDPARSPMPPKLNGTSYQPGMKFRKGAESIRYTLDLNDDGVVDAADQAVGLAAEAQATQNTGDYVMARVTYGYRTSGAAAGTNGGGIEKVGLVRAGTGVPALYTVYLGTNPTPWDWSDGPIPVADLKNITRITLRVTTEGRRKSRDGTYPRATLTTDVNSLRNMPNASQTLYSVSGYVFEDLNRNGTKESGEPGIPGAILRLGTASVGQSNDLGYYIVKGAPGQYVLHQDVPEGYAAFSPDSFVVDFISNPVDVTHMFADTARRGAWFEDSCYVDNNGNSLRDFGDDYADGVRLTVNGTTITTGATGYAKVFLPVGTHSVQASAPDSMMVMSTNPFSITIANGVGVMSWTALQRTGTGHVQGYVFIDTNKNGAKDTGETGIANVWVGVTKLSGASTLGYAMTDANGWYDIVAPNNMPAAVTSYEVTCIPPAGYYPTVSTQISPIWLSAGQTLTGKNFGMTNYTSILLTADRVLSLGVADLLEKDWSGNDNAWDTKGAFDKDLILGSEYVSAPNISVWWNQMPTLPVFDSATWTYQRNAQAAALSIATGSIDSNVPTQREDVVTGLARKPTGNIAVWLTQNSSGNLGYLVTTPTLYQTTDQGDVNQVLLQDCGGTGFTDLIAGTTGIVNTGSIEVWLGNGSGGFSRDEVYPPNGNFPAGILGEVKALQLVDVTSDGNKDLIVGTKTASGQGRVHVMRFNTRNGGDRYRTIRSYDIVGEVSAMTMAYVDSDPYIDLIVGTRITSVTGDIQYWRGNGAGDFTLTAAYVTPGPVLSLATADMGATTKNDIVYGFRNDESAFAGGVRILFLDLNALPPGDVDPAGGQQNYMSPAIAIANFNFRMNNMTPAPYSMDMAVAQKPNATAGQVLVVVR